MWIWWPSLAREFLPTPTFLKRNPYWIHTMVVINDSWKIVGMQFGGGLSSWLIEPCNTGETNGLWPEWVLTTPNPLKLTLYSLWQGTFQMEAALLALIRACVHVCMFTYCAYMHAHMHMCTCGGQGLTLDVLFSLSSLYFLTEGLSLSRKLTASARLAEQQPLGIFLFPPFECRNYSQELHGCWESKLGCSCLYSK